MIARCWLHIGTEKTGSTSIQTLFFHNRAALLARGWLYPIAAGLRAHDNLLAFALDEQLPDRTPIAGERAAVSGDTFRHALVHSLEKEIADSGASALVLSNERLATKVRQPAQIVRLKALCEHFAHEIKAVVYVRNQSDFLASRYTNVIWEGGKEDFDFRGRTAIADYALLLDRWAQVFGKENLVVRRFEPADFPAGDVVADFARVIGLDTGGLEMPARANPSLDAESLAFLRGMNRRLPHRLAGLLDPYRGAIVRVLQRRRGGTRFTIPSPLAKKIEDAYSRSNEHVAAEYFGSRLRPLFSPSVLVSDSPPPHRTRTAASARIIGTLVIGLLRDAVIWAGRRLFR